MIRVSSVALCTHMLALLNFHLLFLQSLVIALLIFISIALDLVVLKKFPTGPAFALVASMIAFGFFLIFLIVRLIDNNENARAPN